MGRVFDFMAVVVTLAWLVGFMVAMFHPAYRLDPEVYAVLTAIIGAYAAHKTIGPMLPKKEPTDG